MDAGKVRRQPPKRRPQRNVQQHRRPGNHGPESRYGKDNPPDFFYDQSYPHTLTSPIFLSLISLQTIELPCFQSNVRVME